MLYQFQSGSAPSFGAGTYLCGTHLSRTVLVRIDDEDGSGNTRLWKMHFGRDGAPSRELVCETECLCGLNLSELL